MKSLQKYPEPLITKHNFEDVLAVPESSLGKEWIWVSPDLPIWTWCSTGREKAAVEMRTS